MTTIKRSHKLGEEGKTAYCLCGVITISCIFHFHGQYPRFSIIIVQALIQDVTGQNNTFIITRKHAEIGFHASAYFTVHTPHFHMIPLDVNIFSSSVYSLEEL
jgi:hypothetical protein